MAKLPDDILTTVLNLERQLLELLKDATATTFALLQQYNETDETIPELDELQTIRERADSYYTRFYVTLRRIYEAQPVASRDNLELIAGSIAEDRAVADATQASVLEIRRNWSLP